MNYKPTNTDISKNVDTRAIPSHTPKDELRLSDHLQQLDSIHQPSKHFFDMKKTKKKSAFMTDIYEKTTQRIIDLLENGDVAWRRTWSSYGYARNFKTGHIYSGINFFLLNMIAPHPIPFYLTFKQVQQMGGKVKKGSKGFPVFFYKGYMKFEDGKRVPEAEIDLPQYKDKAFTPIRFLRRYPVFNIEDIEGIDWEKPEIVNRPNNSIATCEAILEQMTEQPVFQLVDSSSAFYDVATDTINVPDIKQFENSEFYYRTKFHEVAHWTGSKKRLARSGVVEPIESKSDRYAEEELIAELTSNYLLNTAGVQTTEAEELSAGYLKYWIERLKENPKLIFIVAPRAQQATEFILGRSIRDSFVIAS